MLCAFELANPPPCRSRARRWVVLTHHAAALSADQMEGVVGRPRFRRADRPPKHRTLRAQRQDPAIVRRPCRSERQESRRPSDVEGTRSRMPQVCVEAVDHRGVRSNPSRARLQPQAGRRCHVTNATSRNLWQRPTDRRRSVLPPNVRVAPGGSPPHLPTRASPASIAATWAATATTARRCGRWRTARGLEPWKAKPRCGGQRHPFASTTSLQNPSPGNHANGQVAIYMYKQARRTAGNCISAYDTWWRTLFEGEGELPLGAEPGAETTRPPYEYLATAHARSGESDDDAGFDAISF